MGFLQPLHVEIGLGSPAGAGNVTEACGHQHQCRLPVRKGPDDPGAPSHLPENALQGIVRADPNPVLTRKGHVREGLLCAFSDDAGSLREAHLLELLRYCLRLFPSCLEILLRVDRLEHGCNLFGLCPGDGRQDVAIPMDHTALPANLWIEVSQNFDQAETFVRDEQPRPLQASILQIPEKIGPALLVFLCPFGNAEDFPIPLPADANSHQNRYIAYFAGPGVASC